MKGINMKNIEFKRFSKPDVLCAITVKHLARFFDQFKGGLSLEQLPKAQSELEEAIGLSPPNASLHCMLAPVYRKEGLADKAKIEFDRCAALAGNHSVPPTPRP